VAGGRAPSAEELPRLGTVPEFTLTERSGRPVGRADLQGRVWVATFFFTRCQDTCPLQLARMTRLQTVFAQEPDVRLVSITVDPVHDTPSVLAEYAARLAAAPDRWLFLTGARAAITQLAVAGFRLGVGEVAAPSPGGRGPAIPHSARLVLVDRRGEVRGYYRTDEPEALEALERNVRRVLGSTA